MSLEDGVVLCWEMSLVAVFSIRGADDLLNWPIQREVERIS